MENGKITGAVEFFNDKRGWGIIKGDDGMTYFIHWSGIAQEADEYRTLNDGQRVAFEVVSDDRGLKAIDVDKLD